METTNTKTANIKSEIMINDCTFSINPNCITIRTRLPVKIIQTLNDIDLYLSNKLSINPNCDYVFNPIINLDAIKEKQDNVFNGIFDIEI